MLWGDSLKCAGVSHISVDRSLPCRCMTALRRVIALMLPCGFGAKIRSPPDFPPLGG
jgi:hypothetical protein